MSDESTRTKFEAYTNSAGIAFNTYEFAMSFGLTDLDDPNITHSIATLRMSPQHAKSVLIMLERFIRLYEEEFSPIGMPKELLAYLKGDSEKVNDEPN